MAVVLTLGILLYTLRRVRHLLLIVLTVGFGWLVGLCVLSFTTSTVSLIVLGISSVIIGIAVNYPLHFLTHLPHAGSIRQNLRELVTPLLIGNVTTVGAFASLIPLHSVALRDLGVFAAAMLVGTIAFVLVALPHLVKAPCHNRRSALFTLTRRGGKSRSGKCAHAQDLSALSHFGAGYRPHRHAALGMDGEKCGV